jgi:hypothetical protein
MINLIYGAKGSGKTKRIIDTANGNIVNTDGHIIFLTDTTRYNFDIKYQIRLINCKEFKIQTEDQLIGFIRGIIAANSDTKQIYVDGIARIINKSINDMEVLFTDIEELSKAHKVDFTMTISSDTLPEFMKKYNY